jgi:hypothetical protein
MSSEDIRPGARWNPAVAEELAHTNFGILCLTPENYNAPWVLFEAGALAKSLKDASVCPYLIDLVPTDLRSSPLYQFQARQANKEQTLELALAMNRALESEASPEDKIIFLFEHFWSELENTLSNLEPRELIQEDQATQSDEDTIGPNMSGKWKVYYVTHDLDRGGEILGKSNLTLGQNGQILTGVEEVEQNKEHRVLKFRIAGRYNGDRFYYFGTPVGENLEVCLVMLHDFYGKVLVGITASWDFDRMPFASPVLLVKESDIIEDKEAIELLYKALKDKSKAKLLPQKLESKSD